MIAHKVKVVLGVVIAICIVMAIPSFASAPVPDSVSGRVNVYYSQYVHRATSAFSKSYLDSSGVAVSIDDGSYRTSPFISIDASEVITICGFYAYNPNYYRLNAIAFYDSSYSFISGIGYTAEGFYRYDGVPSNASYVRFTCMGGYSDSNARNVYQLLFLPRYEDTLPDFPDAYFWTRLTDLYIDEDGWFYIPYQVYTASALYFDIDFYGSSPINVSSVDTLLYFEIKNSFSTGNEWVSMSLPDSTSYIGFNTYYSDDLGRHYNSTLPVSDLSDASLGLLNFSSDLNPASFSGFTLSFDCSYVSSDVRGRIWNLILGSVEVDVSLAVDDVLNDLDQLGQALVVPSPDLDTLLNVGGVLNNQNDANASMIMSTIASDGGLITTMMVISVSLTVLGYILFGKKEA